MLEGANLEEANLEDAHLEGANLKGTNLTGATVEINQLTLAHTDSTTIGMPTVLKIK